MKRAPDPADAIERLLREHAESPIEPDACSTCGHRHPCRVRRYALALAS